MWVDYVFYNAAPIFPEEVLQSATSVVGTHALDYRKKSGGKYATVGKPSYWQISAPEYGITSLST